MFVLFYDLLVKNCVVNTRHQIFINIFRISQPVVLRHKNRRGYIQLCDIVIWCCCLQMNKTFYEMTNVNSSIKKFSLTNFWTMFPFYLYQQTSENQKIFYYFHVLLGQVITKLTIKNTWGNDDIISLQFPLFITLPLLLLLFKSRELHLLSMRMSLRIWLSPLFDAVFLWLATFDILLNDIKEIQ